MLAATAMGRSSPVGEALRMAFRQDASPHFVGTFRCNLILGATCTYSDDSNVRLSTGAKLSDFLADLSIMDEEPQYADGKPLEHGIGLLLYHDGPEIAAHTIGWFPLRGKNYDAVWDQVHYGAYAGCGIDMWLSPLVSEPPNLVWDVNRPVFITAASVRKSNAGHLAPCSTPAKKKNPVRRGGA
jgi:hypothetical protein